MSIRIRLALFLSLALFSIMFLSIYASNLQNQLHTNLNKIHSSSSKLIHLTEQLDNNFQKQLLAWTNLLLRGQDANKYHDYLKLFYQQERDVRNKSKTLIIELSRYPEAVLYAQQFQKTHDALGLLFRNALLIFNQSVQPAYAADKFTWGKVSKPVNLLSHIKSNILKQQTILLSEAQIKFDNEAKQIIYYLVFLLIIFISLFFWLLDKYLGQPLLKTSNVAKSITMGDYTQRINTELPGEFDLFSNAFNKMMDHISDNNNELEKKMGDLKNEIFKRQVVEKELIQKKLVAEDAAKTKSEFLSTMSHEIRTPLNIVTGYIELLETTELTPEQKSYMSSIISGSESLLAIINDVLDFAKIESGKLSIENNVLSLPDLLDDLNNLFSLLATDKNIEFIVTTSNAVPQSFISDIVRLKQILTNLLNNAFKFTDKGHVKLSIDATPTNIPSRMDLTFKVEDTGIGIDENFIDRIFNHFEQQSGQDSRKFGGTGLGLAICKKLSLLLNADLSVSTVPNEGSTFTLKLFEVEIVQASSKKDFVTNTDTPLFRPAKILIADDMEANRKLIKACLRSQPVEFIDAINGQEAIDLAREHKPDLILMDIKMPEVDGIEATRTIKNDETLKNIPVIAVSASSIYEDDTELKQSLFDGYVTKPVRLKILLDIMNQYLKS